MRLFLGLILLNVALIVMPLLVALPPVKQTRGMRAAARAAQAAAPVMSVARTVLLTIRLWRTQHPQPVLGGGEESGLDPTMFRVLVLGWITFLFLLVLLAILRVRLEKARDEVGQLRRELMMS